MEMCGAEACVMEVGDPSEREGIPISLERDIGQAEPPYCENQETEVEECLLNSKEHSRDSFVQLNEAEDGMIHPVAQRMETTEKKTDVEELMANATNEVSPPPPSSPPSPVTPPTLSSHLLNPAPANSYHFASQCGVLASEFRDGRRRRSTGCNWRNSFYVRQSLEYIACSTVLAVVIPVLGIPAVFYSVRSYRAYKRGGLQQSRRLNLLAFRLILVAGALLCCLAMVSGVLAAYLLARPIQIDLSEPPTMEVRSTYPRSNRNFFHAQGKELLDGRHNMSVLCQSRNRCADSFKSISADQTVLPLHDPSWNPPEPLATLVKRAEMNVLHRPVEQKTSRRPNS